MTAGPRRVRLFTPGPVEIPPRVLRALAQVPPHHRTDGFRETLRRVLDSLKQLHGTSGEVLLLPASGTGAMEAAVVNFLSPSERALAIAGGKFGERWASILSAYGVPHSTLDVEWGHAVQPAAVASALEADSSIAAVFCTHSETSTGALHDVQAIARIARERGRRVIVDAVTSLAVHPLPQDAWGIDVVVCGSQKGLMIPPGIATLSVMRGALPLIERASLPRFYFDLRKALKSLPLGETAFTPPVSLVLALEEALAMMREEGIDQVHHRHRRLAHAMRAGATALRFHLFSPSPSHAVTALVPPTGIEAGAVVKRLREVHGVVVAGGQDRLKGLIVRVGHMGAYDLGDVHLLLGALEECVHALGGSLPGASGASAAASSAWEAA